MLFRSRFCWLVALFAGCSEEPSGTTVSGTVELTREAGSETGQTGFVFPDATRIDDGGAFAGSCVVDREAKPQVLSLTIERTSPDQYGLASFSVVAALEPGSAEVSAVAGGSALEDSSGSCTVAWTTRRPDIGRVDFTVGCDALTGGDEPTSLDASLSLAGCE